ncbi:MAG: phage tail protein, partial [Waterburya sp.]
HVSFYPGSLTQTADPTVTLKTNNSFTMRNRCYMYFNDLPLDRYGNVVPKVEVELLQFYGTEYSDIFLSDVIDDILTNKVGMSPSEFDTSQLANITLPGVILKQDGQSCREFLEDLQRLYQFTYVKNNGQLVFVPLPSETSNVFDIPNKDIGTRDNKGQIRQYSVSRIQENELPTSVRIDFANVGNFYERGTRQAQRTTSNGYNIEDVITTSVALREVDAIAIVTKLLNQHWNTRSEIEDINLPIQYNSLINVNSLVRFAGIPETLNQIYIVTKKDLGANGIVNISCKQYDILANNVNIPPLPEVPSGSITFFGDPTTIALNTNLVYDTDLDYGLYVLSKSDPTAEPVNNGVLWSSDASAPYVIANTWNNLHAIGYLTSPASDSDGSVIDGQSGITTAENPKLSVKFTQGSVSILNDVQFRNLLQVVLIGNELIAFKNGTLISGDDYELTDLIRGVRGTERFITTHPVNTPVYLLKANSMGTTDAIDFGRNQAQLYQNVSLKTIPNSDSPDDNPNETTIQLTSNRLRPYPPSDIRLKRTSAGIVFTWERRNRKQGEWLEGNEDIPIIESVTKYRFKLFNNANTVIYENTNVTNNALFLSNSQLTSLGISSYVKFKVTISQTSAIVGDGHPITITVPISSIEQ